MTPASRIRLLVSGVAALIAFVAATKLESALIWLGGAERARVEWISDVILSLGFASLAYLWLDLRATRSELARVERERIVLDTQLGLAADIQRSLLPAAPPPRRGLTLTARMEPAGKIGGDFYDFFESDGALLFILGDISGKGIPAALLMASTRELFRTLVRETRDPGALCERLSSALLEERGGSPYATCIVGRFEPGFRRLAYVNAGHPTGVLVGASGVRFLESDAPPIGLLPGPGYATRQLAIGPGDRGLFVTDGVTEAVEQNGDPAQILAATLTRASHEVQAICDEVLRLARVGPGPQGVEGWQDDRTVLAFSLAEA